MADLVKVAGPDAEPSSSVLLVHGLSGHHYDTWRCGVGQKPWNDDETFWPLWLARDRQAVAVYVVGYSAPISRLRGMAMHVTDQATSILVRLLAEPALAYGPLVFVGHSLGGLLIKQLLRTADSMARHDTRAASLIDRVEKVAFLGTPHLGAGLATWADRLRILVRPSAATASLVRNDPNLRDLNNWYRDWANLRGTPHLILAEARPTIILGAIVPPDSADPGLAIVRASMVNANHADICKPIDRTGEVYILLRDFITRPVQRPKPLPDAVVERLLAALDARGHTARAAESGVERQTVIALAQRLRPDETLDFDQAVAELAAAVEMAVAISLKSKPGGNLGDLVDVVLARVATKTRIGDIEGAAKEADQGFTEWERAEAERRAMSVRRGIALLEAGLEQDILRRDAFTAAVRVARIVSLEHPDDAAARFLAMRERRDTFYDRGDQKGINFDLLIAIEIARLELDFAADQKQRWTAQQDLGNALRALGARESGTARLEEAVAALRAALTEATRVHMPFYFAMAQNNLGNALWALNERESGTAHFSEAVDAYRAALTEKTRERAPHEWAMIQNNLGNGLLRLGQRENDVGRLEEAAAAYRAALTVRTRSLAPLEWAGSQNNLGNALLELGEREGGTTRLKEAVAAYRAALTEKTPERVPLAWAMTQDNLGRALQRLGEREGSTDHLEEAIAAHRAALTERARERVPLNWAETQRNLGNALETLGKRGGGSARFDEAIAAYRAALTEYCREREPLDWAGTQFNLGNALRALGEREGSTARLEESVSAFRAALTEITRDSKPLEWAAVQTDLGAALRTLGEREDGTALLEEAVAAFRAALSVKNRKSVPLDWAVAQCNLGAALQSLGARESDNDRLEEAVAAYHEALSERTRERGPREWAMTQNNLGNALLKLGARENGTASIEQAVVAYRAALTEYRMERQPLDWAQSTTNLGIAQMLLAERTGDTRMIQAVVSEIELALVTAHNSGDTRLVGLCSELLSQANAIDEQ